MRVVQMINHFVLTIVVLTSLDYLLILTTITCRRVTIVEDKFKQNGQFSVDYELEQDV